MATKNKRLRMKQMTMLMRDYWNNYDQQPGYQDYSDHTFLMDALYGLGLALDENKYRYGDGFDDFKAMLVKKLTAEAHST